MSDIPTFQTLYKQGSDGIQEWNVGVEPQADGTAKVVIQFGRQGGVKQISTDHILEGKNAGRKNATTPLQQAIKEASSRWKHQIERSNYGLTIAESAGKRSLAPMLAQKFKDRRGKIDWSQAFEQPKLDGYRCLARRQGSEIILLSRRNSTFVLPHISETLMDLLNDGDVFDGELYIHGVSLNRIDSLIDRPQEGTQLIEYHVYDSPSEETFADRISYVYAKLGRQRRAGNVVMVETTPVASEAELMAMFARRLDADYEGSMLRFGGVGYESGRRSDKLLKLKAEEDAEFPIVSVSQGHNGIAILRCMTAAGNEFDVTAPGPVADKQLAWTNREQLIGKMVTVTYAYFTETDKPVPWHPRAKSIRLDVSGN